MPRDPGVLVGGVATMERPPAHRGAPARTLPSGRRGDATAMRSAADPSSGCLLCSPSAASQNASQLPCDFVGYAAATSRLPSSDVFGLTSPCRPAPCVIDRASMWTMVPRSLGMWNLHPFFPARITNSISGLSVSGTHADNPPGSLLLSL